MAYIYYIIHICVLSHAIITVPYIILYSFSFIYDTRSRVVEYFFVRGRFLEHDVVDCAMVKTYYKCVPTYIVFDVNRQRREPVIDDCRYRVFSS